MDIQPKHVTMLIAGIIGLAFFMAAGYLYLLAVNNQMASQYALPTGVVIGSLTTLAINRSKASQDTLRDTVTMLQEPESGGSSMGAGVVSQ